jgi:hypothetical protein
VEFEMRILAGFIAALGLTAPAMAEIQVKFLEGAPKDRFVITNTGTCDLGASTVKIDLAGSPYGLIFDVTGNGAGVEVFQPLEFTNGADLLVNQPRVRDGDNSIVLQLKALQAKASVSFTIDVDDTAKKREITVSNSEFLGATARLETGAFVSQVGFGAGAVANVQRPGCA